jgi:hypothetical protein
MGWELEPTTGTAPDARPEFDHSMTLGAAAKTSASLIVWCRDPACRHENRADPAVVARVFGPDLMVAECASGSSVRVVAPGMSRCCLWDAGAIATDGWSAVGMW